MKKRVVVFEDDESLRVTYQAILETYGYDCALATLDAAGLDLIRGADLVISDFDMGDFSAASVRERAATESVPVVLVSGNAWAQASGLYASTLEKPFSVATLLDAIAGTLR